MLEGAEEELRACMERGKNPGLGVRALHEQGITGEGVTVAIIDYPMYLDHPEFAEKIEQYKAFDCDSDSSMHGPAVASLLVGETVGTAPGARLYYGATPDGSRDSQYFADALLWIVEENAKLPEGEKIRAVSVSAGPSGEASPFVYNHEAWEEAVAAALEAGISVLDCRADAVTGFILPGYYDVGAPEEVSRCKPGHPSESQIWGYERPEGEVYVPTSFRTTAEEYEKGDCGYQYTGQGGLSWGIPYATGVLAMGWQVNPALTGEQLRNMLHETGYDLGGARFIDPPAFIKAVRETL